MKVFSTDRDYLAFEETPSRKPSKRPFGSIQCPMRILGYCWLPNHWHFVLWPEQDGELSPFLERLTNTHTQRWQRAKQMVGYGHVDQGRFKSFPIEADEHFYSVMRYVERHALRANLCETAEVWRRANHVRSPLLSRWPLPEPRNWTKQVNTPQTEAELAAIRRGVQRGSPLGSEAWVQATAQALGLTSTLRPRGRPKVEPEA
jgi:putative transposase